MEVAHLLFAIIVLATGGKVSAECDMAVVEECLPDGPSTKVTCSNAYEWQTCVEKKAPGCSEIVSEEKEIMELVGCEKGTMVFTDCDAIGCLPKKFISKFTCSSTKTSLECFQKLKPTCPKQRQINVQTLIDFEEQQREALKCGACGLTSSLFACLAVSAMAYFLSVIKKAF